MFIIFIDFFFRGKGEGTEWGRERERDTERSICCSTYLCIHWLILICSLTGDQTCNLGVSRQCSNQLSYPVRSRYFFNSEKFSATITLNVASFTFFHSIILVCLYSRFCSSKWVWIGFSKPIILSTFW